MAFGESGGMDPASGFAKVERNSEKKTWPSQILRSSNHCASLAYNRFESTLHSPKHIRHWFQASLGHRARTPFHGEDRRVELVSIFCSDLDHRQLW